MSICRAWPFLFPKRDRILGGAFRLTYFSATLEQGKKTSVRRGREYMIQPVLDSAGREMLYILTIYLLVFITNVPGKAHYHLS